MDRRILKTLEVMERDFAQPLKVTQVSAQMGLSRPRFQHVFYEQTGETFTSHLRQIRLNNSKTLLGDLSLSIKEVMGRSGYSTAPSFSRDFQRLFHTSPSEYRRSTFR